METLLRRVSVVLFLLSGLFLVFTYYTTLPNPREEYSWKSGDFPNAWELPALANVHLVHEDSVHYPIDTPAGVAAWKAMLPRGGAVLHLGPDLRPFTLSMFHQLRCLDIVREVIVDFFADNRTDAAYTRPALAAHCMDYLRQTAMCRADLTLESLWSNTSSKVTVSEITHTCKDWTAAYEAAEQNYEAYIGNLGRSSQM